MSSSNDRRLKAVLRYVGLVDAGGVPTSLWRAYRGSDGRVKLAEGIRAGYADLFEALPNAHLTSTEDLTTFFRSNTELGREAVRRIVATFKALVQLADFSQVGAAPTATPAASSNGAGVETIPEGSPDESGVTVRRAQGPGVTINVNLQLTLRRLRIPQSMTRCLQPWPNTSSQVMLDLLRGLAEPLEAVKIVRGRMAAFEADAHAILQERESSSKSRVMTVDDTRRKLQGLTLQQDQLLQEALSCISYGLLRAAHVSAWQAFMDNLEEKLESDELAKVHSHRPNWVRFKTMDDIREEITEYQIIEVAHVVKLLSKNEKKSLHGMLSTRNDCAHPSAYQPDLNETLGYVSGLINRIARLQPKTL